MLDWFLPFLNDFGLLGDSNFLFLLSTLRLWINLKSETFLFLFFLGDLNVDSPSVFWAGESVGDCTLDDAKMSVCCFYILFFLAFSGLICKLITNWPFKSILTASCSIIAICSFSTCSNLWILAISRSFSWASWCIYELDPIESCSFITFS